MEGSKVVRSNGRVDDDVIVGQRVSARVYRGVYFPVEVVAPVDTGSPLLEGQVDRSLKFWVVRHLSVAFSGQVTIWPARDLFQNVALAVAYDKELFA